MTTISRGKVLEALNTIKEVCEQTENCSDCPLRGWTLDCMLITTQPHEWKLVSDTTPWRAFDD